LRFLKVVDDREAVPCNLSQTNGRFRKTEAVGQQETQFHPGIPVFGIDLGGANVALFGLYPIAKIAEAVTFRD
jgi:hypothetical protein